ncbi:hypothetical protein ACYTTR_18175, partial [Cobetia marina]
MQATDGIACAWLALRKAKDRAPFIICQEGGNEWRAGQVTGDALVRGVSLGRLLHVMALLYRLANGIAATLL